MKAILWTMSAAVALAGLAVSTTANASPAKLRLPPPSAPKDQIYSPAAIAKDLAKRGYVIEKMKRKGTTYSITATGPHKNRVQLTVDGRSGDIVGLAVLQAAPGFAGTIAAIVKAGTGSRYIDDSHPFGIIIPDIYQTQWIPITSNVWTVYTVDYVPEIWTGIGYRFAVPYDTIRPGYNGYSVTTFEVTDLSQPLYDVYDANGVELTTEYSEQTVELTEASNWESRYESQEDALAQSYLDGTVDEAQDLDVDDVADYDSEDGDYDVSDNAADDYDADLVDDDGAGDDQADEPDDGPDDGDMFDDGDDGGDDWNDDSDDGNDEDPGLSNAA